MSLNQARMSSFRTSRPSLTSKLRGCKTIGGLRFWNHTFEWTTEGIFFRNISWSSLRVGCRSWTSILQSSSGLFSMRRGGSLIQKRLKRLFLGAEIFCPWWILVALCLQLRTPFSKCTPPFELQALFGTTAGKGSLLIVSGKSSKSKGDKGSDEKGPKQACHCCQWLEWLWGQFEKHHRISDKLDFDQQVGHFKDVHVYPGPKDADGTIVRWAWSVLTAAIILLILLVLLVLLVLLILLVLLVLCTIDRSTTRAVVVGEMWGKVS